MPEWSLSLNYATLCLVTELRAMMITEAPDLSYRPERTQEGRESEFSSGESLVDGSNYYGTGWPG